MVDDDTVNTTCNETTKESSGQQLHLDISQQQQQQQLLLQLDENSYF
jgi:hypothetical protein